MTSLRVGIIGLPNAGKTTLFNALSRAGAQVASYPFTTVESNVGIAAVPDPRLDEIAELADCDRRVPETVRFVDIAGLVEGASRGEGLGNRFLANIREVDAVLHVIRCFQATGVSHVSGEIDPVHDAELIETELRLADLEVLGRMIEKARREAKSGDRACRARLDELCSVEEAVGGEGICDRKALEKRLERLEPDTWLLSIKPTLLVLNVSEGDERNEEYREEMSAWARERGMPLLLINAEIEEELAELEPDEAAEFEKELGMDGEGLFEVIKASHALLGLITFFSIDSNECRAWPIPEGSRAPFAAGRIHSDFEEGFIKAEVVHYHDFLDSGGFAAAKGCGKLRVEGREYIVQDGDVIHFKFSV